MVKKKIVKKKEVNWDELNKETYDFVTTKLFNMEEDEKRVEQALKDGYLYADPKDFKK